MKEAGSRYHRVLRTCPNRAVAQDLATAVITERLATCVNVVDGITSLYEWEGKIIKDGKVPLYLRRAP